MDSGPPSALDLAIDLVRKYEISSLNPFIQVCRETAREQTLNLAVFGRFKAGKSSFLNHFLGQEILPTGVLPVTSVITEIAYGGSDKAAVHFADGRVENVSLAEIRLFVAESENSENVKGVTRVVVESPLVKRFGEVRFIDTPGVESASVHNTETALQWLPHAGLAFVAIGVDPPLSQQDLQLLEKVYQYTPSVWILLTKVDLLSQAELGEVMDFVCGQVRTKLGATPAIFPYSVRNGYDHFRQRLEHVLLTEVLSRSAEQRTAILKRKLDTLLGEAADYLNLALKSAQMLDFESSTLRHDVVGNKEALNDLKSEFQMITKQAAGGTRAPIAQAIEAHQQTLEARLLEQFEKEFPSWTRSLSEALSQFERWLQQALAEELGKVSDSERQFFLAPVDKTARRLFCSLQNFRDRLSERSMKAFGAPLRTTEMEIRAAEPRVPDIRIGRVFDRNWELLSAVLPMWAIGRLVGKHFRQKISYLVYVNCSRVTSQWEESVNGALSQVEKEARRRLEELVATVERLTSSTREQAPEIGEDLERLAAVRAVLTYEPLTYEQ